MSSSSSLPGDALTDAGAIAFSPGHFLKYHFLGDTKIEAAAAKSEIAEPVFLKIISGEQKVDQPIARKLALLDPVFDAQFWLNMQETYDTGQAFARRDGRPTLPTSTPCVPG